ncbi:hypothetical protein ABZU32_22370 [Sphaerisporangium sp. NPDC005288]|uniref:hypothetical protein n=1 Tax=Sphaerisporangium sp. NPDC005288 TaxID=3155114 RepID=UPI0033AE6B70
MTETFDGSRMPEDKRAEVESGRAWWQTQMASTLERLAELCAARYAVTALGRSRTAAEETRRPA